MAGARETVYPSWYAEDDGASPENPTSCWEQIDHSSVQVGGTRCCVLHLTTLLLLLLLFSLSDGIGRTGAFACIYSQLERVKTEAMADFFQYIKGSRFQRSGLVQTLVRTYNFEFYHKASFLLFRRITIFTVTRWSVSFCPRSTIITTSKEQTSDDLSLWHDAQIVHYNSKMIFFY